MGDPISRQFARWSAALKYEDLPPAVVDKVKALTFHHLVSSVFGAQTDRGKHSIDLVKVEEGKPNGATVLYDGAKVTRVGAAFINSELMHVAGMYDSYRMITHPGPMIIPPALANAELQNKGGKDLITALAAGYEVMTRITNHFVPSTAARGFRPSPIFGALGSAVASAKLLDLNEDQTVTAIALGATLAAGTNEGPRTGGGETSVHDPNAARTGVFAAIMARESVQGTETAIEGRAGFLNAFTGNHEGKLSYSFGGETEVDLSLLTEGLGSDYELLTVMFRMYGTGGFNQPVIDLMAELRQQHDIDPDEIEQVLIYMNYLETLYPTPAFPREPSRQPGVGTTHYFAAHAAVNGGYPQVGGRTYGPTGDQLTEDKQVLEFTQNRVRIIGEFGRDMFSPAITVQMKNGARYDGEYPYQRMEWNFDQLLERQQDPRANFPLGPDAFDALVDTVKALDSLDSLDPIHKATQPA